MSIPNVLFLCTGNSARSQMAEAILRHHAGDRFNVYSAGLEPKGINPYTRRALEEIGLDMAGQYSKDIREYRGRLNVDYLFTVCGHADQNCPISYLPAAHREHWPFDDPAAFQGDDAATLAEFRRVRNKIDARIRAWLNER